MRRRAPVPQRSLDDFDLRDQLCWLSAWFPPHYPIEKERSRWRTWTEFLADYRSVRAAVLAEWSERPAQKPIFAERILKFVEAEGVAALEACVSYDQLLMELEASESDSHGAA